MDDVLGSLLVPRIIHLRPARCVRSGTLELSAWTPGDGGGALRSAPGSGPLLLSIAGDPEPEGASHVPWDSALRAIEVDIHPGAAHPLGSRMQVSLTETHVGMARPLRPLHHLTIASASDAGTCEPHTLVLDAARATKEPRGGAYTLVVTHAGDASPDTVLAIRVHVFGPPSRSSLARDGSPES